jgi:hypothetical protein
LHVGWPGTRAATKIVDKEDPVADELERVSMDEVEAESATSLPNKEVLSLLDINANVDLGLDLAAPVDLAAAANLNVAAPIEAAASANLLSPDAQAIAVAQQHGSIDQGISGTADATAPQHAEIVQNSNADGTPTTGAPQTAAGTSGLGSTVGDTAGGLVDGTTGAVDGATGAVDGATGAVDGTTGAVDGATGAVDGVTGAVDGATGGATGGTTGAVDGATGAVGGAVDGATSGVGGAVDGATGAVGGAVDGATSGVGDAVGGATGGVDSLLSGGSLLDANVDIHANANLTAPIDGAVAANANVAAPIDAAVSANIGSDHGVAEAMAVQEVDIHQHLDDVEANATAEQDASVSQQ